MDSSQSHWRALIGFITRHADYLIRLLHLAYNQACRPSHDIHGKAKYVMNIVLNWLGKMASNNCESVF